LTLMRVTMRLDLQEILKSGRPVILELGCGNVKKEGRIGIDRIDLPNVDIVADLEEGLPFLPDNSVDEIHSKSLLEHVDNLEHLIREIARVLKKGGKNHAFVPHFSNPYYYSDYTHRKFFGLYTFYYFVDAKHQLKRKVPTFYSDNRIIVLSTTLVFTSPFRGIRWAKQMFGRIVNSHPLLQELYEENLCYLVPCYGIHVVFTPDK
jgi:SAM-dependent methyltransferase